MPVKINGSTSGSVTLAAPATGSDVTLTLPTLGFGKVLQVVSVSTSGGFSTSSGSYVDWTGLSLSITPSSTSSKVLVFASLCGYTGVISNWSCNITRTSTQLIEASVSNSAVGNYAGSMTLHYLDSPSTTSATTYKIRAATNAGTFTAYLGSSLTAIEVGP